MTAFEIQFNARLAAFIEAVQFNLDQHYEKNYAAILAAGGGETIGYTDGPKYIRVFKQDKRHNGRSVFCFIDKATGDILKGDGWKRPAKGVRGNLFSERGGLEGVSVYGANYAR